MLKNQALLSLLDFWVLLNEFFSFLKTYPCSHYRIAFFSRNDKYKKSGMWEVVDAASFVRDLIISLMHGVSSSCNAR